MDFSIDDDTAKIASRETTSADGAKQAAYTVRRKQGQAENEWAA
jgi:hypothetical protein